MSRFWLYEIRFVVLIFSVCLVAAWATGYSELFAILGAGVYFTWQFLRLNTFVRWLQRGRLSKPPSLPGVWGELCYLVYRFHERGRKKQRRLRELLQRYQATTAALPDAALVLGRDYTIQWLNEAASKLLALRPGRDIGQRIDNLLRHPAFVAYLHGGDYSEPLVLSSLAREDSVLQLHIVP
ncbi:MAG: phosphate regulon sensor protein PhoR, partial [Gammaproteobacteria bacterium]